MRKVPKPGERYRHFKDKLYQIVAIAKHSETEEPMVVYQALYGDFGVWVRPLSMFLEKVDREKYPDTAQEYRFEEVADGFVPVSAAAPSTAVCSGIGAQNAEEEESPMHPLLLEFLDTDSAAERLALLQKMKGKVGQREVDSLCFCLDVKPMDGDLEMQLESLKQYIRMQQRYDAPRLRKGDF